MWIGTSMRRWRMANIGEPEEVIEVVPAPIREPIKEPVPA